MFGNLGAFVNGNMFAGLFGSSLGVKLGEEDLAVLSAIEGAGPFGPVGRPMGGYVSLPSSCTAEEASRWVRRAQAYVATLPPKKASSSRKSKR
jgi:TfoX/Sxy family transcriptional regulator of competence genes